MRWKVLLLIATVAMLAAFSACARAPEKAKPPETKAPQVVEKPGAAGISELAEKIRKGEVDVGREYGVELGKRFHNIHAETLKLPCNFCHKNEMNTEDLLYTREYRAREGAPAPYLDVDACIACHQRQGIARELFSR